MAQIRYHFNPNKLTFEKAKVSFGQRMLRFFGFIAATSIFAFLIIVFAYTYLDSPKEKQLKAEIENMNQKYEQLNENLDLVGKALEDIQDRDDNIYRVIFEAEPIDVSLRNQERRFRHKNNEANRFDNSETIAQSTEKIDKVIKRLYIQSRSFDEVTRLAKDKQKMLASIPAIRPLSAKDQIAFASGFGSRIDPIYKTIKMHTGLDFTANTGKEIHASGDGVVSYAAFDHGYGNHVIINHGFSYQTLYGHMSKIKCRPGQRVKRGEIIGYVGSTGKSTAPHLHYEVIKNGTKINPVNFFYNDITPAEYEQMLKNAENLTQSFD